MKKYLFILTALCFGTAACSDEGNETGGDNTALLELSAADHAFDNTGGQYDVTVSCDATWRLTGSQEWCVPSLTKGGNGDVVTFNAEPNDSGEPRETVFSFFAGEHTERFVVRQSAGNVLQADRDDFSVGAQGGNIRIRLLTNVEYRIEIDEAASEWISEISGSRGAGADILLFQVAPNAGLLPRTGEVLVRAGRLLQRISISQLPREAIEFSQSKIEAPKSGYSTDIVVQANVPYTFSIPETDASWIRLEQTDSNEAAFEYHYTLTIAPNEVMDRATTLEFVSKEGDIKTQLSIAQEGEPQLIEIPDAVFRKHLEEDGYIVTRGGESSSECELTWTGYNATRIICSYSSKMGKIMTLEGIEHFVNCQELNCSGSNGITRLDLSRNSKLRSLNAKNNPLQELVLGDNSITSLDLTRGLGSSKTFKISSSRLTTLNCSSNTSITGFDISGCPALKTFNVGSCSKLTALDVSHNPELTTLTCTRCTVLSGALDLRQNAKLASLDCRWSTKLTQIILNEGQTIKTLNKPDTCEIIYQ